MTAADIISALEAKFGPKIASKNATAIDPFVVVAPADLVEICQYLKTDPALKLDILSCLSGVDNLELDPKKVAKAGFEPHTEVVYHLQSFPLRHRFTLKLVLPR